MLISVIESSIAEDDKSINLSPKTFDAIMPIHRIKWYISVNYWRQIGELNVCQSKSSKDKGFINMGMLSLRKISLWSVITNFLFISSFTLIDQLKNDAMAIAETHTQLLAQTYAIPSTTCPQLTNRRYVVISDRPTNLLPQLPQFLAIAAVPCSYLNASMTFFGGFDNAKASLFRAKQLRELGLDAIVYSFNTKLNDIPANFQAAAVLVESGVDPNMTIQQVRSLTGKSATFAQLNNRTVILAAPLSSQQSANAIAGRLRNQGIAAQMIGSDLIAPPTEAPNVTQKNPIPEYSTNNNTSSSKRTIYRILIPNANANTLKQAREFSPDAFTIIFKNKQYIQVHTYFDRANAHSRRDQLNIRFPGTILLQD